RDAAPALSSNGRCVRRTSTLDTARARADSERTKGQEQMKRTILAAAAALLAVGGAHAQMMPPYSTANVYGELGYTWLKIDAAGTSSRPDAIRGIIGYDAHPYGAIEFMPAGGVNDDNKNGTVTGV